MRMKRKDTQLLVENWRRLIKEGTSGLHEFLVSFLTKEDSVIGNVPSDLKSFVPGLIKMLREDLSKEGLCQADCDEDQLLSVLKKLESEDSSLGSEMGGSGLDDFINTETVDAVNAGFYDEDSY